MPSIDQSGHWIKADFSISDKDANGNFRIDVTFKNKNSTSTIYNVHLSCSLTNSSPWTWAPAGGTTIAPGGTGYGSCTISSGNTSSQTVYCYVLYGSLTTGPGGGYPVTGYVDPTPDFYPVSISVSPSTQIMGRQLQITDSGGTGVTSVSHQWYAGNASGSFSTGSWTIPIDRFEPLCTGSSSISTTFRTSSSGPGGSGYRDARVEIIVPPDYVPAATHEAVIIDPVNYSLVAGISKLRIELQPYLLPEGLNSATISSTSGTQLLSVASTNPAVTTSSFTKSGNNFTSGVLPTYANAPSYTIRLTFRITDSRGRTADYTTGEYKVTNFIPPYCQITNLHRDTSTTGTLEVSISSPSAAYSAKVKVGSNGTPVDVMNQLVPVQGGYTLTYHITGLLSGEQYPVTFYYKDANMNSYGEAEYAYSQLLSTMSMPLSLFDNGYRMAASFGEECADNYGEDVVINFAKDAYIRYVDGNTEVLDKVEKIFGIKCPYPIGGIYLSTDSANPSTLWANTTWQAIGQGRVLIGVGTGTDSNGTNKTISAGDEGGEYTHTLTIAEMPAHSHTWDPGFNEEVAAGDIKVKENNLRNSTPTSTVGGNGAHNNIQPYLGVYMWERIS